MYLPCSDDSVSGRTDLIPSFCALIDSVSSLIQLQASLFSFSL